MSWSQAITEARQQRETSLRFGREMRQDEASAVTWLGESSLPPEMLGCFARMMGDGF